MATYRVGNHQPQNLYRDDQYIGVMFTAEDAALVVEALHHVEQAHGPALPITVQARRASLFNQPHSWTPNCGEACNHDGPVTP
jgi:hypothetical protein